MTEYPPDNVFPIDPCPQRRERFERALEAAGFIASTYLLDQKLHERGWIADSEQHFAVAVRRLRMLIDGRSGRWLRRRQQHDGRYEFRVEVDATLWIIILDRALHRIINAYPSDWR